MFSDVECMRCRDYQCRQHHNRTCARGTTSTNLKGCQQNYLRSSTSRLSSASAKHSTISSLKNAAVPIGKKRPIESLQLNAHLQLEKKKPHEIFCWPYKKLGCAKVFVQSKLDPLTGDQEKQLSKATEYLFLRNVKRHCTEEFGSQTRK